MNEFDRENMKTNIIKFVDELIKTDDDFRTLFACILMDVVRYRLSLDDVLHLNKSLIDLGEMQHQLRQIQSQVNNQVEQIIARFDVQTQDKEVTT